MQRGEIRQLGENNIHKVVVDEIGSPVTLDASGIAEYIRFDCCPRYFKLKIGDKKEENKTFKPISPLLFGQGKELERTKIEQLKKKASAYIDLAVDADPKKIDWEEAWSISRHIIQKTIENAKKEFTNKNPVLIYQVPMKGQIGTWELRGIADLIAIWPAQNQKVKVKIFEIKSSWKEQTAHRIQVAIYALLLSQILETKLSNVKLEGGVINKESDIEKLDSEKLLFRLDPLIQDVERLLSSEGELHRIYQMSIANIGFQLCQRCDTCGFNENCITRAVENQSIALLNLTRGEQNALNRHGVKTLEDLAKLKFVSKPEDQLPYNFREVQARDIKKVHELSTDPSIGAKLDRIIQRAQFMLFRLKPASPYANRTSKMPWLTGTGYGNLPEDSALIGSNSLLSTKPDGMIRVYLHVQWDYMLDIVCMASARVNCTCYRGEPISVSKIVNHLLDDREESIQEERQMLEAFFSELVLAVKCIANNSGSKEKSQIHLYFYTQHERDLLMEAVRRHSSLLSAQAVRDLLGLRQAIDQPMFSIIQNEVLARKALGYHSSGLLPVLEQCGYFDSNKWIAKRSDGSTVNLYTTFGDGFFHYKLPFVTNPDDSISFLHDSNDRHNNEFYPAKARFGNQIPLEYIWAAKGRIEGPYENGRLRVIFEKRKWCDYRTKNRRISDEELTLLSTKLCLALEHIERSLTIRNRRLKKEPISIPTIAEFTLGSATLEKSCREFLDLEYYAKRQDLLQYYALLPFQRVASGRSVIFKCTNLAETERRFIIKGKLICEGLGLPAQEGQTNVLRIKGSDGTSSGDWMVINEVHQNSQGLFEEVRERSPSQAEKSARVIIDKVDLRTMEITINVISWPSSKNRKYSTWHNLPTSDPEKANKKGMQLFEVGKTYILDELADDIISERAAECLDYANSNAMYGLLSGFLAGKKDPPKHTSLSKELAANFLGWVEKREHPPKPEQKQFIERVFGPEQIVMLQGPPGTGKTETLQLAVLAHAAAHGAKNGCRILMVAPTHKAIQEFVGKLAEAWRCYSKQGGKDLKDLRIIRVLSNDVSLATPIDGVEYLNYNEDEKKVTELKNELTNQGKLVSNDPSGQLILCVTPPGMYGLMKKIGGGQPLWGEGLFDLLVVDEASMMRLPELILSGAFINSSAQILVAGDHRQLPPIQAHDWRKEDRRTLEEMASFLSAQDFLRLLRQEDVGIDRIKCLYRADIPAERLCETHRCHKIVAEFLREWVYDKDGIDFRSDQTKTLPLIKAATQGLDTALKPENVFVLIVHDEMESFQSNHVEAQITNALIRNLQSLNVGVVTPHNAQRGLVKNMLTDGYEGLRVDTVERYQGGESDVIIISTTVSDPDYVRGESDFLLNLNRINVAISRMKKKIIIIASRSIFEFMPQNAQDYDASLLWRGIAQTVGFTVNSDPRWKGSLSDLIGQKQAEVEVKIYCKSAT